MSYLTNRKIALFWAGTITQAQQREMLRLERRL